MLLCTVAAQASSVGNAPPGPSEGVPGLVKQRIGESGKISRHEMPWHFWSAQRHAAAKVRYLPSSIVVAGQFGA